MLLVVFYHSEAKSHKFFEYLGSTGINTEKHQHQHQYQFLFIFLFLFYLTKLILIKNLSYSYFLMGLLQDMSIIFIIINTYVYLQKVIKIYV